MRLKTPRFQAFRWRGGIGWTGERPVLTSPHRFDRSGMFPTRATAGVSGAGPEAKKAVEEFAARIKRAVRG